ncbi:MAG TPA: ABC transporter substrate-binding protein [Candidatus Dormibacteraeota bacterium]|nr:ABC transporter substrate-binding protein [Candidatus Dormibacteraeota bacterium]
MRFDRRAFLGRGARIAAGSLLLPGAAALLDACAAQGAPSAERTPVEPRRGGQLIFATEAEINSFDPRSGAWDSTGLLFAGTVYDPLFTQAADGSVRPYLAQSISPNADFTRWTLRLRPGIRFHDGTPLDAAAVKVNLDGSARSPLTAPYLFNMTGTRVIDSLTLQVTTGTPWVPFPSYLTRQLGYMAALRQLADTSGRAKPIGTGPFLFKEWLPGDHFTATRNPDYWRPGLPYLDAITYRPIPDPRSRGSGLEAGDVDLMHSSDTQNVADFRQGPKYRRVSDLGSVLGEPDQNFIMLNTAVPPLDDVRVRRALAHATDRQRVIDTLYNGLTKPADGPFMAGSPYHGPTGYPAYDPAAARALIADYARQRGPVSFRFSTVNTAKLRTRTELLQAMWREVGIQTEIVPLEQSPLILDAISGNFQACGWRQFNTPDPDANYVSWSGTTAAPVGRQALNFARNRDPQLDAALEAGRTQVDPQVRAAAYRLVAQRLGADVPYLWLSPAVWIVAARPHVGGLGEATLPDGARARGMISGVVPVAELWRAG